MKIKISHSLLAAAMFCGMAQGQTTAYTTPVGYAATQLTAGFNLIGLTLHQPTVAAGIFDSSTATTLTDNQANFTSVIVPANTYLLEMADGGGAQGVIIEVPGTFFTATSISGLTGITSAYQASYKIRKAVSLAQTFGEGPTCVLTKGDANTADLVFIPDGAGGFGTFYHSADLDLGFIIPGKWEKVGDSNDQGSLPINYLDGMYVQVRGATVNLTVSGEVKTEKTLIPAATGFTYLSGVYPVGSTLGSSGLSDSVLKGDANNGDLVFMPDGLGGFATFYHSADLDLGFIIPGKWEKVGDANDQSATPFTSGYILQRRGANTNMLFSTPSSYSSL